MSRDSIPAPDAPDPERGYDPLDEIVQEFAYLLQDRDLPDIEEFCSRYPEQIRSKLRRRCEESIQLQAELRLDAAGDPPPRFPMGTRIGEFELQQRCGFGGMGEVYLARQESLNRRVALKIPFISPVPGSRAEALFVREAQAGAKLRHPSIVRTYATGVRDGVGYIAMEYVRGKTLAEIIQAHRRGSALDVGSGALWLLGRFTEKSYCRGVAELVAQMADALQLSHEHGVIHRDIKPGNVIVDPDGVPHITDFGLAKILSEGASVSRVGDLAGTPWYMSPEQTLAHRVPIDHRTDIFSLGVVLYELLTMRRAFGERTTEFEKIIYEISFQDPPDLRKLNPSAPRDLETICHRAMEKQPDRRYQRAGELAADLRRFLNTEPIQARPPSVLYRIRRGFARHRVISISGAIALAAVLLTLLVSSWIADSERLRQELEPVRLLVREGFRNASTGDLVSVLHSCREIRAAHADLSDEEVRLIEQASEAILAGARERRERGMGRILEQDPTSPLWNQQVDFTLGMKEVIEASLLLPENEVVGVLEAWSPKLSVRANVGGAEVVLIELDRIHGNPMPETRRNLGTTPLENVPVLPGLYTIVLRDDRGYSEQTRLLSEPGELYELEAELRPSAEVQEGMAFIEAGSFVFGHRTDDPTHEFAVREVSLEGFWIDTHEVSNRDYRAFVQATDAPRPRFWSSPYDASLDDLPVVGVSHDEARAYAEWAGKRLPTAMEWERAARGVDGRTVPLPDRATSTYAVMGAASVPEWVAEGLTDEERKREAYLGSVRPVGEGPAGPEGLLHTLGNVAEWTATLFAAKPEPDSEYRVSIDARTVKGGAWFHKPHQFTLDARLWTPVHFRENWVGFRCAKSATP